MLSPACVIQVVNMQLVRSPEGLSERSEDGGIEVNTYGTFTASDRPGQRRVSARSRSEPDVARSMFGPLTPR